MRLFARFVLGQFTLLAILLATVTPSQAQGPGGDRESRDGSRHWGGGQHNPADFLKRMDTNGNGLLEPSEISDRARPFIERMAKQAGLDPNQPLPIDKLVQAAQQSEGQGPGGPPRPGNGPSPGGPGPGSTAPGGAGPSAGPNANGPHKPDDKPASDKEAPGKAGTAKTASGPTLPGFGTKADAAKVPGFGDATTTLANSASGSSSGTAGKPAEGASSGDDRAKVRRYAEALLKQYDTNKNGSLEKDEWSTMRPEYQKADTNGDGVITLDELTDYLAGYGQRRDEPQDAAGASTTTSSDSGSRGGKKSSSASSSKPKRFLTATERLPEGLPSWFARCDLDGDGQVSMWEFASVWTEAKAAEFAKYDLNGDGVITPQEVLQVERGKGKSDAHADAPKDASKNAAK